MVEGETLSAAANLRIDGSLSPGVRLRPAMRCRMVVMTISTRVPCAACSFIRTAPLTITVRLNCTGLLLAVPAVEADKRPANAGSRHEPDSDRMDEWFRWRGDLQRLPPCHARCRDAVRSR